METRIHHPHDVRPFVVAVPEPELDDLRQRIRATRWPERETVADASQGVQLATMKEVARYWADDYDWRRVEARLNELPQFLTEIDGLDIHFVHVRSPHEDALPLIVTHGWPGSFLELLGLIGPLTDPTAHGGRAADAFHLVIPSMPGYGFSGRPSKPGWEPARIGRAWVELMRRLGYDRFVAQGGDWGAIIVDLLGADPPPELLAIHTNLPLVVPTEVVQALHRGEPPPTPLSAEEQRAFDQLVDLFQHGLGYAIEMANQPQTLTGLADSPAGLAAFLLYHDRRSYDAISRLFVDGEPYGAVTRDDLLDNVTLYWLTNTAVSAARLYWENRHDFVGVKGVRVPVAVSVFPDEVYEAPRSWAERAYPQLLRYRRLDRGGHFAAWSEPMAFADELRESFRAVRT